MANNHSQFTDFNESISITKAKKDTLKSNRKTLREKIRKYFNDNKPTEIKPCFRSQGSFVMKTTVNPIPEWSEEENKNLYKYDIDYGVYFIGKAEDRKTIDTYHSWIYDAVKDHTDKGAMDKTTCIRVLYADGHHIDLPIYFKIEEGDNTIPQLAHKSKDWIDSDPKAFFDWFNEKAKNDEQLRRIVRYLKAWRDFRHTQNSSTQMPSGFILTILAANNISYFKDRDDIALKETLSKIQNTIDPDKGGTFECFRPTTPDDEDLFANYSDTKRDYFLSQLDTFVKSAKEAVEGSNPKESCEKWQKHFGDRFSCSTAIDENEAKEKAKAFTEGKLKLGTTGLSTTVGIPMATNKGFYGDIYPKKKPNPQIQVGAMQKYFPKFNHYKKGNNVVFKGDIFVVPEIPIYTISIECGVDINPKVKVINPKLKENAPHTYLDKSLCLYHPSNFDWDNRKFITNEIIQWTVVWIYFYEFWLQTGKWIGPEVPHNLVNKNR